MKLLCLFALVACATASVVLTEDQYQSEFINFVAQHSKAYGHDEFFPRYNTFKANFDLIREHNAANHSYTLAINEFADLTSAEFGELYTGYNGIQNTFARAQNTPDIMLGAAPNAASIDWVAKGAVTGVKNQGQCGSCWAFSTTGSVEGAHQIKSGTLVSLSEQQLVDCASAQGNQGCNGGLMDNAFQFIIANKGLCKEADYPYKGVDGTCQTSCAKAVEITGFKDVAQGDENALMTAVNLGPVSVAIEADQSGFQFYSGGVFDGACGTALDHGVLAVGYGTDGGKDYWKVKNSWGASWGEQGYIRMVRGKNQCGIASEPSYPIAA